MKSGETLNIVQKLNLTKPYDKVRFRLSNGNNTITKDLTEDSGGVFVIPLYQQDTHQLEGRVTIEAEVDYTDKSVRYSNFNDIYLNKTLGYDPVENNQPSEDDGIDLIMESIENGVAVVISPESAEELITQVTELFQDTKQIAQSVRDDADAGEFDGYSPQVTVKTETPSTYVLHIKDADHEFDTPNLQGQGGEGSIEVGDGLKREGNVVSADLDDNSILEFNNHKLSADTSGLQPTITAGNGIDVSSDVVSVDLRGTNDILGFTQGQLMAFPYAIGQNESVRQYLVDTAYSNPLASKSYVDNLISGRLKRLVVESLPTQDIDTNTIYMILKSVPTTNNIYDEYMYINNAWELIGSTEVDLSNYYTKTESDNRYNAKLTVGNGIDITSDTISTKISGSFLTFVNSGLTINTTVLGSSYALRQELANGDSTTFALASKSNLADYQPKLTAGTNITITDNVISASGGGTSYTFTDGLAESSGTVGIDLKSGTELQITNDQLDIDLSSYATTTDLSSKQATIDSTHKLSADLVDDTNTTNKFTNATEKQTWNAKADNTTISTDTSSTTVSLTLADNHEYRYTQDLTSLNLTMPSGDFISSIVFASGSTPTSMTYDSSIKWSGNDVSSNAFVPQANQEYEIVFWYNGLSINAVVRGVA